MFSQQVKVFSSLALLVLSLSPVLSAPVHREKMGASGSREEQVPFPFPKGALGLGSAPTAMSCNPATSRKTKLSQVLSRHKGRHIRQLLGSV